MSSLASIPGSFTSQDPPPIRLFFTLIVSYVKYKKPLKLLVNKQTVLPKVLELPRLYQTIEFVDFDKKTRGFSLYSSNETLRCSEGSKALKKEKPPLNFVCKQVEYKHIRVLFSTSTHPVFVDTKQDKIVQTGDYKYTNGILDCTSNNLSAALWNGVLFYISNFLSIIAYDMEILAQMLKKGRILKPAISSKIDTLLFHIDKTGAIYCVTLETQLQVLSFSENQFHVQKIVPYNPPASSFKPTCMVSFRGYMFISYFDPEESMRLYRLVNTVCWQNSEIEHYVKDSQKKYLQTTGMLLLKYNYVLCVDRFLGIDIFHFQGLKVRLIFRARGEEATCSGIIKIEGKVYFLGDTSLRMTNLNLL